MFFVNAKIAKMLSEHHKRREAKELLVDVKKEIVYKIRRSERFFDRQFNPDSFNIYSDIAKKLSDKGYIAKIIENDDAYETFYKYILRVEW